jgi:hypothetical protein
MGAGARPCRGEARSPEASAALPASYGSRAPLAGAGPAMGGAPAGAGAPRGARAGPWKERGRAQGGGAINAAGSHHAPVASCARPRLRRVPPRSERFAPGDKSCDDVIIPQISGYCLCEGNVTTARCAARAGRPGQRARLEQRGLHEQRWRPWCTCPRAGAPSCAGARCAGCPSLAHSPVAVTLTNCKQTRACAHSPAG